MKSNTNHKKHAATAAPVAAPARAAKEDKVKAKIEVLPPAQAGRRTRSRKGANGVAGQSGSAEAVKTGRLALIKARHESMKREIDQIREDLESDEDE